MKEQNKQNKKQNKTKRTNNILFTLFVYVRERKKELKKWKTLNGLNKTLNKKMDNINGRRTTERNDRGNKKRKCMYAGTKFWAEGLRSVEIGLYLALIVKQWD